VTKIKVREEGAEVGEVSKGQMTETCRPQGGFDLFSLTHSLTKHPSGTYQELGAGATRLSPQPPWSCDTEKRCKLRSFNTDHISCIMTYALLPHLNHGSCSELYPTLSSSLY